MPSRGGIYSGAMSAVLRPSCSILMEARSAPYMRLAQSSFPRSAADTGRRSVLRPGSSKSKSVFLRWVWPDTTLGN